MIIRNSYYTIEFSDANGSIIAYNYNNRNLINAETKALLEIKLLDQNCKGIYLDTNTADFTYDKTENGYCFLFENIADYLSAKVFLRCPENEAFVYWSCEIKNNSSNIIEWIGLPGLVLKDTLKSNGGDSEIFWPFGEGCVIDDMNVRQSSDWMRYREITGQSAGYNGTYPGPVAMQFMAYYNENGGLYVSAEDAEMHLKSFEYYPDKNGVCFEVRIFANGAEKIFKLPFEIKTGIFDGDWQDAAEIYREWLEKNKDLMPEKIINNKNLPEWYSQSPVIALYPIRGTIDHGDMTPNMYYPYENVLPYVDMYSEKFKSRILALPMHWEGTAPWAPPFVWPPYGGEEQFKNFAEKLHEKNNLLGVYCSGLGWTTHSYLDEMDISDKYDEKYICKTPEGKIVQSKIIGPPIRDGYDMCPESDEVAEIVKAEIESLANVGCDYTQYFDQNLGGNGCMCYAKDHGHPYTPGKWQCDAMVRIFKKATENVDSKDMLIGCEAAAAEPFIKYLPFNDLRNNISFFFGKPVPAYAYVYHEYVNNFMGNQNTIHRVMDLVENPENLLFRTAYSFASGDMLSVCLAKEGKVSWGWDVEWDTPEPNQDAICKFIGNINPWRYGFAKKYLHTGRMVKAEKVSGIGVYNMNFTDGRVVAYPDVLVTAFKSQSGEKAMLLTNYLADEKELLFEGERKIWSNPDNENEFKVSSKIKIAPHSAILVEF